MRKRYSVCLEPGCPELTLESRCPEHARERNRKTRSRYSNRMDVYRSKLWMRAKRTVMRRDKFCQAVTPEGARCYEPATECDHVIPLDDWEGDPFDVSNLQGLCKRHHSQKTAREVRGRR